MALKLPIDGPFGFDAAEGYRRLSRLEWNPATEQVLFELEDFKDEATRRGSPGDAFRRHGYAVGPVAVAAGRRAVRGAPNNDRLVEIQAVPSYAEFMAGPIGDDLPGIGPHSTRAEVLAALGYAYVKTRDENKEAEDI